MAAISKKSEDHDSGIAWGAEAIGKVINRPPLHKRRLSLALQGPQCSELVA